MNYTIKEFYLTRGLLLLLNPLELILLLGPPLLIFWRIQKDQAHKTITRDIWIFPIAAWPVTVAAQYAHLQLIVMLLNRLPGGHPVLEEMLTGDGVKMLMGAIFGGAASFGYYVLWLALLSPILLLRKTNRAEQAGGAYGDPAAGSPSAHP